MDIVRLNNVADSFTNGKSMQAAETVTIVGTGTTSGNAFSLFIESCSTEKNKRDLLLLLDTILKKILQTTGRLNIYASSIIG